MMAFSTPQSRNEAILQNILGADNELPEPQSRIEDLLRQVLVLLQGMTDQLGGLSLEAMTTAEYEALENPDPNTLYILTSEVGS